MLNLRYPPGVGHAIVARALSLALNRGDVTPAELKAAVRSLGAGWDVEDAVTVGPPLVRDDFFAQLMRQAAEGKMQERERHLESELKRFILDNPNVPLGEIVLAEYSNGTEVITTRRRLGC